MTEDEDKGEFKVIQVTSLKKLATEKDIILPESDLTIQTDKELIQLSYKENERERKKYIIRTGCFILTETGHGTVLSKFDLSEEYDLLETIDNTSNIIAEKDKFFKKLHVYNKLKGKRQKRRSILICSMPGVGKSAAINKVCRDLLEEDDGTCVVFWDTADTRASVVNRFFLNNSKFSKKVKRLVVIIEDIQGGTTEDEHGAKGVDTSLLNFLDGVGSPFKGIPTFIIATTNNPERAVGVLIDRPGRFDKVINMQPPNKKQCVELLAFISDTKLSAEDIEAAGKAAKHKFSISHLQEIVVRSLLDEITMLEACEQLIAHKKRFKEAFQEAKGTLGLGNGG